MPDRYQQDGGILGVAVNGDAHRNWALLGVKSSSSSADLCNWSTSKRPNQYTLSDMANMAGNPDLSGDLMGFNFRFAFF